MNNCRVCLQLSNYLTEISSDYREQFTYITGVELRYSSEYLCKSCLGRLIYAMNFREEAQMADNWFRENFDDKSIVKNHSSDDEEYVIERLEDEEEEYQTESLVEFQEYNEQPAFGTHSRFVCDICSASNFKSKSGLEKHMRLIHCSVSPFVCEFCGQNFKAAAPFKAHVQNHTIERIKCPEPSCKASFRQLTNMNKHLKEIHANARPFVCKTCDSAFDSASSLELHRLQKHLKPKGEKLKCTECMRVFKFPSQLKQHMASHFGEKNFECKFCEKSYFKANNLRRHYQNAHLAQYKKMLADGELRKTKGDENIESKPVVEVNACDYFSQI